MSEKKAFNDDMEFQSFSKNIILESNKDINKTSQNENLEFSFKKNLFLQKPEDNTQNYISPFNDQGANIYSKNDTNIQESGHFGKYDSKNFKSIIDRNSLKKKPLFYIEEKFNRYNEEERKTQNLSTLQNNSSNSSIYSNKIKKIQMFRKKKSDINSKNNVGIKNLKADSFFSLKNYNKTGDSYLYKKKLTNNNININNISNLDNISRDSSYETKNNNTFYRVSNTLNINEIPKYNKCQIINLYKNNHNFNNNINISKKMSNSKINNIKPKIKTSFNNNSSNIMKNIKNKNKENIPINLNNFENIIFHNENIHNIIINNNQYCPNFNNIKYIKYINYEPQKTYRSMYIMNKSSNKTISNFENFEKIKNDIKIKNNKKINNINCSNNNSGLIPRSKNIKLEKENKIKNYININFGNPKLKTINNKSIYLYKTRTHKSRLENKKGKNISCNKKVLDKVNIYKERFTNCYDENHGINF